MSRRDQNRESTWRRLLVYFNLAQPTEGAPSKGANRRQRQMARQDENQVSTWQRVLIYFGLAYPADGAPSPSASRRSRYGIYTSPRLDEDIDELRRELDELRSRDG